MQNYYDKRAAEYEQIYYRDDPVRLHELAEITTAMRNTLGGLDVLEIACGTGYWTQRLAGAVHSITATDASSQMLDIARAKGLPESVSLLQADAYDLSTVTGAFDGCLATFWFSHIPKARLQEFLDGLHSRLSQGSRNEAAGNGARVFMADNCNQPGVGGDLVELPGSADTFKRRYLSDGSEHMVLKNYYDRDQLASIFNPVSRNIAIHVGECYWWVSYDIA